MSFFRKTCIAALCAAGLAGCVGLGANLLSTHDEVLVGVALMKEVESQELLSEDEALQNYVDDVGRRLVRVAKRTHIPYTFKVLDVDDRVDAFALPGGYFYVTTGFLRECASEAELAAIMAHELAHVIARHHGRVLSREYGPQLLQGQLLGSDTITTGRMTRDILTRITIVHFSERQERDADEISTGLLVRAGYDAQALPTILLRLYEVGADASDQPDLFSGSFVPTPERIDRLYELYLAYPAEERALLELYESRFERNALSRLD